MLSKFILERNILFDLSSRKEVLVSFDNKSLPEFQTTIAAYKEIVAAAFQDRTIEYPALFVINSKTLALYPAVIGEFTVQELDTRMQTLIPKIIAFERRHR